MPDITLKAYRATLCDEAIDRYREIHDAIPRRNLDEMKRAGFTRLVIFEDGPELLMLTEQLAIEDEEGAPADQEANIRWRELTDPCFASPWKELKPLFHFAQGQVLR